MLEGFQLRVSRIVLETIEPYGFALGGGCALQMHGIINRSTKDIDSYAAVMDDKLFNDAETALINTFEEKGFQIATRFSDSWFKALEVCDPSTGEAIVIDIGYDYRENDPVIIAEIGPVLDVHDVITGKVRAFWDRQAVRDFVDIDAILQTEKWTPAELLAILRKIRPEVTPKAFADILSSTERVDDEAFERYLLNQNDINRLKERLYIAASSVE